MTDAGTSRRDQLVPAASGPLNFLGPAGALEQRLVVLMAARLALSAVSLGIALAVDTTVGDVGEPGRRGLYGTVALAFLATAVTGFLLPRVRRPTRFATLNIGTDIGLVSALVHFSGGPDSLFAFLYVVVALYGTLLFERRAALLAAGVGTAAYGGVLLLAWLGIGGPPHGGAPFVLLAAWGFHAAAIGTTVLLASTLARELRQRTFALERLEDIHQRIVASLMSGLLTTDREGRITSFNPEAQAITGLSAAASLGRPVAEVLPGAEALYGRSGPERARLPFRSRDGRDLHLGVGSYALRSNDDDADGRVVIFQDVTDVVAMEHELRRSERLAAVGELSASIAHEIRNPLAAISGSIQMLRRAAEGAEGGGEDARLMDIVLRETERLNRLISDFLRYARPGPIVAESVDVKELLGEMREMWEPSLPTGIGLAVDVPAGLRVQADPGQLQQVLWNLVINSAQAMPEGGEISVTATPYGAGGPQGRADSDRNEEEKEACVEICVLDTGAGIPRDVLENIFDPFFTTKAEGSGLGLATVHRIVEEHGGSLHLESREAHGTCVRVRLPRGETSG